MEKDIPELPDLASVVLHPAKGMLGEGIKLFNRSFYCMISMMDNLSFQESYKILVRKTRKY